MSSVRSRLASSRALALSLITGAGLLLATGCQTTPTKATAKLPPPTFNPPVISRQATLPPPEQSFAMNPQSATVNGVPREWIPRAPQRKWLWIVIHHTATPAGSLAKIDAAHRAKGWENGAGYDFVVGNGTNSRNGQIEVSPRWTQQMVGAHDHTPDNRFNEHGIGIVMVGNFDESRPSKAQIESTARLVAYLMKTYRIPPDRVLGHRDTKATECPGKFTSIAQLRSAATRVLADAGDAIPTGPKIVLAADGELLQDVNELALAGK